MNELAVTNAVLQQEVPVEALTGDLALALEKNEALETKVQECVDDLVDVGKVLADEVVRRKRLEAKLAEARAEIASASATQNRCITPELAPYRLSAKRRVHRLRLLGYIQLQSPPDWLKMSIRQRSELLGVAYTRCS